MFDLEQAITDWRRQMLAAGIKSPVPLDELELHLRDEIERQIKSGLNEQKAFELSVTQIGRPKMLQGEFKKAEGPAGRRISLFALLIGAVIILRILTEHPDAAHLRKNEQVEWILAGTALVLFGLSTRIFIKSCESRDVSRWKLAGIACSSFAVWISMLPIYLFLMMPRYSAAVGTTDRILIFAAVVVSLLSVPGWHWGGQILPVIPNRRTRSIIGIVGCLLVPVSMVLCFLFFMPYLGRFPAPLMMVLLTWAWTLMAILGGIGYGLTTAAGRQTMPADA